jgi:GT2 family glycosyltransferase
MKSIIFVSIIITTYKRYDNIEKIIFKLSQNYLNFKYFEILICDSFLFTYPNKIKNLIKRYSYLKIKYYNINENIHSIKRNIGIKKSSGDFLIFLDDDCFPEKNFIKNFYKLIKKIKYNKVILSGSVKYENLSNNFLNYRQSRQFCYDKSLFLSEKEISPKNIVTMNFACKKNDIINILEFDERFNRYGFEDYEFAYRAKTKNFKLLSCGVKVVHKDERSFSTFLNKISFLALEGMSYLMKINIKAAKKNNFYKLENNLLIRLVLNIKFSHIFLNTMIKFLIILDKYRLCNFFMYKLSITLAYLYGVACRKHKEKSNLIWYK